MNTNPTPPPHQARVPSTGNISLFFALAAAESLGGAVLLLNIPADPKNAVFLGFSFLRWIGIVIFGALLIGTTLLAVKTSQGQPFPSLDSFWQQPNKKNLLLGIACIAASVFGGALLLPDYRVSDYAALLTRLKPFLLWLFLVSLQTISWISSSALPLPRQPLRQSIKKSLHKLRPAALTISALGAVWAFMAFTGTGVKPDTMFWNGSAVPLILWQIFAGLVIGFLFYQLESRLQSSYPDTFPSKQRMLDILVCLVLWVSAVLIWNLIPQQDSYFAPGPYPPNNEFYPYSDAAVYDLNAEFAVIGQGLSEQEYVDKPFYSWILFILHRLSRNQYSAFLFFYTALMATIIPIIYLIGRALKSRYAGIGFAMVVLLYETNAITATPWINAPNARLLLTEPACRLGLALFTLWFIQAHRDTARKNIFLVAAGGALGLTTMIRYNAWFILPAATLWILLAIKKDWKRSLIGLTLFMIAFLLPLLPWMFHTSQTWVTPYFFLTRFRGTVWMQRYAPDILETEVLPEFTPNTSATVIPNTKPAPLSTREPSKPPPSSLAMPQYNNPFAAILDLSSRHFFHNLVTSILGFPDSFLLNDIEHTIRIPNSHWLPGWDQRLNPRQILFLAFNLTLLGIGIGFTFKEKKAGGLIPLIVYLTYNFGLAFARTSGGRYLAPIEWIPMLYYVLGWFQIIRFGKEIAFNLATPEPEPFRFTTSTRNEWKKIILVLASILVIGLGIPCLDQIIPAQHIPDQPVNLEKFIEENYSPEKIPQIKTAMNRFLNNKDALILTGKGLYPRYYQSGEGEAGLQNNTQEMAFSRLTFTLIDNEHKNAVILPLANPPDVFPHGAIVTVVGCTDGNGLDALLVIVETSNETILYQRATMGKLTCPLEAPDTRTQ